jgi:predicted PurR-regulated permease PerM
VASFFVAGIVIIFVGIFGAAAPAVYKKGLLYLVPSDQRRRVEQALDTVADSLRGWLVGQAVLMVMMAVTTTLGLWLLGIPMALTLGLLAGILELIPYVGAWLSAVPAGLVALLLGPWHLAMTLTLYLALHYPGKVCDGAAGAAPRRPPPPGPDPGRAIPPGRTGGAAGLVRCCAADRHGDRLSEDVLR